MFDTVAKAQPDAILGLTEAFKKDPNPAKINLGIGVFTDKNGATPLLACVREAEQRIMARQTTKTYITPNNGTNAYVACVQRLLFGADHEIPQSGRAITAHAPGGTGALRLAADYLNANHQGASLWLSDPTWANHAAVFQAGGVKTKKYPYFDTTTNELAFEQMMQALQRVPAGDLILLHACCHNPTGVDPQLGQWRQIGELLAARHVVPLLDFAYQGFGEGLAQDAAGLGALATQLQELMVCSSFSKNFGLYNERVGALTVVAGAPGAAEAVLGQLKVCIRRNYSNPPAHGSSIVTTVLQDGALRGQWEDELKQMRHRIHGMRELFAESLDARGIVLRGSDNRFVVNQKGLFSLTGLSSAQVEKLRSDHSIYIVADGRINVAAMTEANMACLCDAIAAVY